MHPTLAAEFPNDNPELHLGAIWFCRETVGPPEAEAREISMQEAVTESGAGSVSESVSESVSASESVSVSASESASEPEPEPEPELTVPIPLESVVVLARPPEGEIESAVDEIVVEELDFDLSHVPLESAPPVAPEPEPEPVREQEASADPYVILVGKLVELANAEGGGEEALRAMLEGSDKGIAEAWGKILRNESDDMTACGAAMLDEWAADLVARAVGAPARAAQLRRELRARGVCAFGLIEAA